MKRPWLLLPVALALAVQAQTNSPLPATNSETATAAEPKIAPTNSPAHATAPLAERATTEIFSDSANFDLKSRVAVYIGHVRVVDPQMKLTCELMTATVPQTNGRPDSIVAEQNVVIDAIDNEGKPIHATGDKAVYTYRLVDGRTNETVVLTGDPEPHIQRGDDWMTGNPVTWDRANNSFSASHLHTVIRQETKPRTNTPPVVPKAEKK